jgi:hypothetical protein
LGPTEVGGFGISDPSNLLYIEDIRLVRQTCSSVSVEFHDTAVADFFDEQVDLGRSPEQFARVWIHTHPANCAEPSPVDEETFARVFGGCTWAIMAILAKGGQSYARLRFGVGPTAWQLIPVEVDYSRPFPAADFAAWQAEYTACVRQETDWLGFEWDWGIPEDCFYERSMITDERPVPAAE